MLFQRLSLATAVAFTPAGAHALGFRLFDHDAFATARGDAYVATADNPSAIYYNPAGITQLQGHQARAGVNVISLDITYDSPAGRETDIERDFSPVPGFYYTYTPTNLPVSFGVGYYLPFGLSLEWPDNAPFRGTVTSGALAYHTLVGVAAWQVTKTLSIAAGPTFNYSTTDLRRGIAAPGDEFKFKGDDFDLGFSAGLLWKPHEKHAFGLAYRSATRMDYEGKSRVLPVAYQVPEQDASAKVDFPQVIVAGYSFRPTPKWNLEVNIDWTDWDTLNTPILKQGTGNVPLPLEWESSWAVEAGATRYFDNGLHLSGGYVFLENSVPEDFFNPLVPDQDLHVFSVGLGGRRDRLSWDVTYQFTYSPGRDVSGSINGPAVDGDYVFLAHAFSVSLGWRF
jgi:long-chain fatty acid transport protein